MQIILFITFVAGRVIVKLGDTGINRHLKYCQMQTYDLGYIYGTTHSVL